MKYSKTFIKAYFASALLGITIVSTNADKYGLSNAVSRVNNNYMKTSQRYEVVKGFYKKAKPGIFGFAVLAVVFRFIGDQLV